MRILGVIAHIGKGGGQVTQSLRILRELAKKNSVALITLRTGTDPANPPVPTIYAGDFSFPKGVWQMSRKIRQLARDFDVVQCFDGYYSFPAAFFARKKPYFLRFGMDSKSFLKQKGVPFPGFFGRIQMLPCAIKDCSAFIVNSEALKDRCRGYDPIVIGNGFDEDEFTVRQGKSSLRQSLGLPQRKTLLLYTGKIVPWKNIELVFEALKSNKSLFFVVVGEPADKQYHEHLIRKYCHLSSQFAFHPEVPMDKVKYYLKACDAFVFPSKIEGSPNVVLEAMAAGMPVICSDIPAHSELVSNGKNGFLFTGIRELSAAIRLIEDKNLCSNLGMAAQGYVASNHSIKHAADKYIQVYQSALRKCKS
jgi:glycosyltransferase involved in cell wall biosynthesis